MEAAAGFSRRHRRLYDETRTGGLGIMRRVFSLGGVPSTCAEFSVSPQRGAKFEVPLDKT